MMGVQETSCSAGAMLRWPALRRVLIARFRRVTVFSGAVPGADLGGVFGEGGVSHVVHCFDAPL